VLVVGCVSAASAASDQKASKRDVFVLDLDTKLPFPCPATKYFESAFRAQIKRDYAALFRVVRAEDFLGSFASDRSHMKDPEDSTKWLAPPPEWQCIATKGACSSVHACPLSSECQVFLTREQDEPVGIREHDGCQQGAGIRAGFEGNERFPRRASGQVILFVDCRVTVMNLLTMQVNNLLIALR
jgi:hypothetical protein